MTLEEVKDLTERYRNFLYLCGLYRGQIIVPTHEIDKIWHVHILDTEKYAEDCQEAFGYFLHHFPYLGLRGEQDEADHITSFRESESLYIEHFGEKYNREAELGSLCSSGLGGCAGGDHVSKIRPTLASFNLQ